MKSPPTRARNPAAGFSLTEVVVALGVATVAIVSILALFPVGFDTVRESAAETQAAVLAQTIANDMKAGVRNRSFTQGIFMQGGNIMSTASYGSVDLRNQSTNTVGYRNSNYDFGVESYQPLALQPRGTGTQSSDDMVAELTITPVAGLEGRLAQANLRISSPPSVPLSNRIVQEYLWLIGP